MKTRRRDFWQSIVDIDAPAYVPTSCAAVSAVKSKIKRGVSLYSYQEEYYTHAMTMEDCIADVAAMGAAGIEIIAEEMVPNYPTPPESWVKHWYRLMNKYHTKPTCLDTMVDVNWGGHRKMSLKESVDTLVAQLKLAKKLGFKAVRPTTGPVEDSAPEMVERAIPYAEKYDVKIAPEIHAPIPLKGKYIDSYLELIARTGTRHIGFTLDMGVFCKRLPRVMLDMFRRRGAQDAIIRYMDAAFQKGVSAEERIAETVRMGGNETDKMFSFFAWGYGPLENDPKDLLRIMPYIYNIHGKFYEMTEDYCEYSIPYDEIIPVLIEGGYDGFVDSEYEGQRHTQDVVETDSSEQIRRHQVMLRRLLGEI
jgi:sugar phosphate isomerase/epimerase